MVSKDCYKELSMRVPRQIKFDDDFGQEGVFENFYAGLKAAEKKKVLRIFFKLYYIRAPNL